MLRAKLSTILRSKAHARGLLCREFLRTTILRLMNLGAASGLDKEACTHSDRTERRRLPSIKECTLLSERGKALERDADDAHFGREPSYHVCMDFNFSAPGGLDAASHEQQSHLTLLPHRTAFPDYAEARYCTGEPPCSVRYMPTDNFS